MSFWSLKSIFLGIFCSSLLLISSQWVHTTEKIDDSQAPLFLRLNPQLIDVFTLGHRAIFDDYLYLWLLQKLVRPTDEDEVLLHLSSPQEQSASKLHSHIDQIKQSIHWVLPYEPKIETLYQLSCFVLAFDLHEPKACEDILKVGMRVFPSHWLLPTILGFLFAFPLKDHLKGSYYYFQASRLPKAPPYLSSLAKKLAQRVLTDEEGQEFLQQLPDNELFKKYFQSQPELNPQQ